MAAYVLRIKDITLNDTREIDVGKENHFEEKIIIGVCALIGAIGLGILIPVCMDFSFKIDNYGNAKEILENVGIAKSTVFSFGSSVKLNSIFFSSFVSCCITSVLICGC